MMLMIPNKLYKIGRNVGLNKADIDNVINNSLKNKRNDRFIPPIDVYKASAKYGTVSIFDFSN